VDVGVVTNGGPAQLAVINKHPQWMPDRILVNLDVYERSTSLGGKVSFLAGLEAADSRRPQLLPGARLKIIPNRPSERLCRNLAGLCQTAPRFSDEETDTVKGLTGSGVELLNLPRPKLVSCQAADPQSFIFDTGGSIFKCWEEVGLADRSIGSGMDNPFSPQLFRWMSWNPYRQPHCRICGLLPWCQGGCLAKPPDEDCGLWHYSKNDLLKLIVLENEKRAE
jgi:radical SAM protein with 4Fe4S-binding SPASM domain